MPPRERKAPVPLADQVLERASNSVCDLPYNDSPPRLYLPSGCTLLNLAMSDRTDGGYPSGRISNIIGDSDTGKTILSMHALAEACQLEAFDNHKLIYADVESSLSIDPERMFGKRFADRVDILSINDDNPPPETMQELHYDLLDLFDADQPFIYVLDSLDYLASKEELDKTQEERKAFRSGKETTGTMGMSKSKYYKRMLRECKGQIEKTDSLFLIISQTIANIGSQFDPKTVAGNNGLQFSCRIRYWLSVLGSDKVKGRVIGRQIKGKVSKNHITGKRRTFNLWVYDNLGVDDVRTSLDFLITEGALPKMGGWIQAFDQKLQIKDLIHYIEDHDLEKELAGMVQAKWNEIEESLKLERKCRYE